MATCDCGNTTGRLKVKFETPDGRPLPPPWKSICPACRPSEFSGHITHPSEQKLWMMEDVETNEYEWVGGVKKLKDWAQADLEARIGRRDEDDVKSEQEAIAQKRKRARELRTMGKTSLTPAEIEVIENSVRAGVEAADREASGLVNP